MYHEVAALFFLGIFSGLTVCGFSCLPLLGPFLLSTGNGFKDGISATVLFILGKITAYSALGGLAALLGHALFIDSSGAMRFVSGAPLIAAGVTLPLLYRKKCGAACRIRSISCLGLGLVTSLLPCPSLMAVFALAAKEGNVMHGLLYGLAFSSGLMVSPLLIIGGGISMISDKIRREAARFMPAVQVMSGIIMILLGTKIIFLEI